jgi:hypothetical protein
LCGFHENGRNIENAILLSNDNKHQLALFKHKNLKFQLFSANAKIQNQTLAKSVELGSQI